MTPHCSGPCNQGRLTCQTPDACEREEFTGSDAHIGLVLLLASAVVSVSVLIVVLTVMGII